jgi:hypothetical protein
MQIEAEFRRRNRSGTDYVLERTKIQKSFEETEKRLKDQAQVNELTAESIGCLIETAMIYCTLAE